jgi:hypothetical protein
MKAIASAAISVQPYVLITSKPTSTLSSNLASLTSPSSSNGGERQCAKNALTFAAVAA